MRPNPINLPKPLLLTVAALLAIAVFTILFGAWSNEKAVTEKDKPQAANQAIKEVAVDLSDSQLKAVTIGSAETRPFFVQIESVASVAYQDRSSTKNVNMSVVEQDSTRIRVGNPAQLTFVALPEQHFSGKVTAVGVTVYDTGGGPAIDPSTHRIGVRCQVSDPKKELLPGMLGTALIDVAKPMESPAIPESGVVREGDGTMTIWLTQNGHHFVRRVVQVGLRQDGYAQILSGLEPGEQVVTRGAIFLGNLYAIQSAE